MDSFSTLQAAIHQDPYDETAWLALADSLGEAGKDDSAEMVRLHWQLRQVEVPLQVELEQRLLELWERGTVCPVPTLQGPLGMLFVLVPPGAFWMGAIADEPWMDRDELPQRRISLPHAFYISTTPVTQKQWETLQGHNPSQHPGPGRPVERVAYWEAREFCTTLGRQLGRRCRLPSEFEWEYACRAGTSSMYASGNGVDALRKIGWCSYDGEWDATGGTQQVGRLRANAWGLYDMHGNVWEWCANVGEILGHPPFQLMPPEDSRPADRAVRGGSYRGGPWFCRSAERSSRDASAREVNVGFRVLLEAPPRTGAVAGSDPPSVS
ncbi:MAG: formylglycine-generating enzyme family protein [Gemmataceae bacterium]